MNSPSPHPIPLPGIDGANPLGFLAALGAWRIADQLYPGTRMHWEASSGYWLPTLHFPPKISPLSALMRFSRRLKQKPVIFYDLEKNLNIRPAEFRAVASKLTSETPDQEALAWLSAVGSEIISEIPQGKQEDMINVTPLRLLSGSGRQDFIPTLFTVITTTTLRQCVDSAFIPWSYGDEKLGLRWDPLEDKRYALRWKNPSPDPTMTQRGANRLAIEGLPLLPAVPVGSRLETTGFTGHRSNDTFWTWPIWESPISIDIGRSLLALRALQNPAPDPAELSARGIAAVYRSQRITTGKFRNFTPASAL